MKIFMPRTRAAGLLAFALFCVFGAWAFASGSRVEAKRTAQARAEGLASWEQVYTVLTHPRCINCHTATSYPQQGEERRRHFANVVRGPDGHGVPGLNCVSCHQQSNADSTGVPGGPDWHLAPLSMKWQDADDRPLPSGAVCRQVIDRRRNGNLSPQGILKHHEDAALVLWAWEPGRRPDGSARAAPPMTHAEFVAATRRWVGAGTPCPSR